MIEPSGQDSLKKDLDLVNAKIRALEKAKNDLAGETGGFLWESPEFRRASEGKDGEEILKMLDGEAQEKKDLAARRDEILWLLGEKKKTEEARRHIKGALRELEKSNRQYYETIGRVGFQAYREGLLSGGAYDVIFSNLRTQRERANVFEVELRKNAEDQGSKGFWEKLLHRSRGVYLKSSQNLGLRNLTRSCQRAGEMLTNINGEGGLPPELEEMTADESLKAAFAPVMANLQKKQELLAEERELEAKEEGFMVKLEEGGTGKNPSRSLSELEQRMESLGASSQRLFQALGFSFWGAKEPRPEVPEFPSALSASWDSLLKEEYRLYHEKEVLDQRVVIRTLEQKRAFHEGEISRLENRLMRIRDEADSERAESERIKAEIARLTGELEALEAKG
ncbi:MAG: hypothetical protein LBQ61_07460 [Spirochaetales bacterium]|nr:hypothetical protein [Spirochaetales bacterium]